MAYPLVPPPASDTGAIVLPRTLQRWLDVNPITRLTRTRGYFTLPQFSVEYEWKGYSELIAAFNYEGPNNFSLQDFTPPRAANYLLCIAWIDADGLLHRYKLWDGVGEVIYFTLQRYGCQKIGKNFRLEIWSAPGGLIVLSDDVGSIASDDAGVVIGSVI